MLNVGKVLKVAILAALIVLLVVPAAFASVYDYAINSAVQTGAAEITVEVQAEYCGGCNPNYAGNPGCTPFEHSCTWEDGTYAAIRLKDSSDNVLAMQKLIITPANWPMAQLVKKNFIFPGVPMPAGSTVTVEADLYCSWCGHYYPTPVNVQVQASNTQVTYTGATSGHAGTTANVSATLLDDQGAPLAGKTVTFTLGTLPGVSAVTDSNGVAASTVAIPDTMAAGTYQMVTRFAGEADLLPSSDTDDFVVNEQQQGVWFIFSNKIANPANTTINLIDTNGDGKNDKADVTFTGPGEGVIVLDVKNIGTLPISASDIRIDNPGGLNVTMTEGATFVIEPNKRKAIGFTFISTDAGTFTFSVSL